MPQRALISTGSVTIAYVIHLETRNYSLVTLHRPSDVDSLEKLEPIVSELIEASTKLPAVFVAHLRTIKSLESFGQKEKFESAADVAQLEPLPYIQFMNVATGSRVVIT